MKQYKINTISDLLLYKQQLKTELKLEELKLQTHWQFAKKNVWALTFKSALGQMGQMKSGWGMAFGLIQNLVVDIKDSSVFKDGFSWSKLWNSSLVAVKNYFGVGVQDDSDIKQDEQHIDANQ